MPALAGAGQSDASVEGRGTAVQEKRGRRNNPFRGDNGQKKRRLRSWLILGAVPVLAAVGYLVYRVATAAVSVTSQVLPCRAADDVTIFGDSVLYYDNSSIFCLNGGGGIRWSFPVGSGARFSCSDTHLTVWNGAQLYIIDSGGHASYSETMDSTVQFARIGSKYCAVVIGSDTEPTLLIKNLDGTQADFEREEYSGMFIMDAGFYGEADQYLWTLAYDYYGVAVNTVLNTYQVAKRNTGKVNLASYLPYKVLWENNALRVITTQQMYKYDYKAVLDNSATQLVHGWQFEDSDVPRRGDASILLVRTAEITGTSRQLTKLRVFRGENEERYNLTVPCIGAAIHESVIYAFSEDRLYYTRMPGKQFSAEPLPLPGDKRVTSLIGITAGNRAIIACEDGSVYSITLPK